MSVEVPLVKPQKLKEYDIRQSKYKQVSPLPIRTIILASSGGGKTILIPNLILFFQVYGQEFLYFRHQ